MLSPTAVIVLFVVVLVLLADPLSLVEVEVDIARGVLQAVSNLHLAQPIVLSFSTIAWENFGFSEAMALTTSAMVLLFSIRSKP